MCIISAPAGLASNKARQKWADYAPTIAQFLIKMRCYFVVIFRKLLPKEFLNRPRKPKLFLERVCIFYCVFRRLLLRSPFESFVIFYFSPSDLWLADVSDKYKIGPCLGLSVGAKRKNGFLTLIPLLGSSAGPPINTEQLLVGAMRHETLRLIFEL